MVCVEKTALKKRLRDAGILGREVANYTGVKYYTVMSYLSGYAPMPAIVQAKIEELLKLKGEKQE